MALQYVIDHLVPNLDDFTNGTFDRVQQYVIDHSVELSDRAYCVSPSAASSISDNLNSGRYEGDENSCSSSTQFDMSVSQLSSYPSSSNSRNSLNSDDFKDTAPPNLLRIPSELKQYMDHYPNLLNIVQNNIDLISAECSDLENYMRSDFGIFSLMKEALLPQTHIQQNQNLEMISEMTEILQEKINEMDIATKNLNTTQEAFQNILETFNSSSK